MEILLHAGMHKTATTSIQDTLWLNRERLESDGFLYPASWPANHSIPIFSLFKRDTGYFENVAAGYGASQTQEIRERFLQDFRAEIAKASCGTLILSAENLTLLSLRELKEVRSFLNKTFGRSLKIRVWICVRHPVPWAASAAQQRLKSGQALPEILGEKLPTILPDLFRVRIGNLLRVFGSKAVSVYRFEDSLRHEAGPVGHFLSRLGYSPEQITTFRIVKANAGMSQVAAELMSFLNQHCPMVIDRRPNPSRSRADLDLCMTIRGPKFDISAEDKRRFRAAAQADLRWLKRKFDLELDDERSGSAALAKTSELRQTNEAETLADLRRVHDLLPAPLQDLLRQYLKTKPALIDPHRGLFLDQS